MNVRKDYMIALQMQFAMILILVIHVNVLRILLMKALNLLKGIEKKLFTNLKQFLFLKTRTYLQTCIS